MPVGSAYHEVCTEGGYIEMPAKRSVELAAKLLTFLTKIWLGNTPKYVLVDLGVAHSFASAWAEH